MNAPLRTRAGRDLPLRVRKRKAPYDGALRLAVFCRCETAPVLRRNQSRPRGLPTSSMSAVMTATQHRAMSMPGLNMSNMR